MEIETVKHIKQDLEREIARLLCDFTVRTGLPISRVEHAVNATVGLVETQYIHRVAITVEI